MNEMEIDTMPLSTYSGFIQGPRRPPREHTDDQVLATTEQVDENGGAASHSRSTFQTSSVTQQSELAGQFRTHDPTKIDQDVAERLKSASYTERGSSPEDEPAEGEIAWTMPLVQPRLLATGLCYDVRMRYHCELEPPKARPDFHPEDPRRIYHIYRELCQAGLYKDPQFDVPIIDKPLERIRARDATAPEICLVHTPNHYHFVASTAGRACSDLSTELH